MNRRFLRWVLDITHKTENYYSRSSGSYFFWAEPAARWNSLFCAIIFSFVVLVMLFKESTVWWGRMQQFAMGGFVVHIWFIFFNMRFLNKMRRKKRITEARHRTCWMLNATPIVFIGWIVISFMIFVGIIQSTGERNLVFLYLLMCIVFPYAFTRFWVTTATTTFHAGYGKKN